MEVAALGVGEGQGRRRVIKKKKAMQSSWCSISAPLRMHTCALHEAYTTHTMHSMQAHTTCTRSAHPHRSVKLSTPPSSASTRRRRSSFHAAVSSSAMRLALPGTLHMDAYVQRHSLNACVFVRTHTMGSL
jgi:hypothetical protein